MKEKAGNEKTQAFQVTSEHTAKRLYFLDNLKIALTCLVVAHHTSQAYIDKNNGWPIHQDHIPEFNNKVIGIFTSVNSAFFMALFFMIAAYFVAYATEKKPINLYLKERTIKLGIPIIIIMFIIFPFVGFLLNGNHMTLSDFIFHRYFNLNGGDINFGQTWFVFDLLIFTYVYVLASSIKKAKQSSKNKIKILTEEPRKILSVPNNKQIILVVLGLAVSTFGVRLFFSPGYWVPLHTIEPASAVINIAAFVIGILAYKNHWIEKIPTRTGAVWGIVSVVMILSAQPIINIFMGGYDLWAKGFTISSLILSLWETILCIGLCISLMVLFREKFNFTNGLLKSAARNSFAVYLVHPFVIIPLQAAIINVPMHPFIKAVVISIIAIILSYALCQCYAMIKSLFIRLFSTKNKLNQQVSK